MQSDSCVRNSARNPDHRPTWSQHPRESLARRHSDDQGCRRGVLAWGNPTEPRSPAGLSGDDLGLGRCVQPACNAGVEISSEQPTQQTQEANRLGGFAGNQPSQPRTETLTRWGHWSGSPGALLRRGLWGSKASAGPYLAADALFVAASLTRARATARTARRSARDLSAPPER
jgi:hypothetical protein